MEIKRHRLYLLVQSLLFSLSWFFYATFISPYAFITIDECSATPGTDSSMAFIILPVYFLLFDGMIFYIVNDLKTILIKIILAVCFVTVLPLLFGLIAYFILDTTFVQEQMHRLGFWFSCYKFDCYGDLEVKDLPVNLITAALLFFSLWIFLKWSKKQHKKDG